MPNRLAGSASTYLGQHADNPVDWWPWCAEAFDEARRRDVPVLLSVGYAACHWCHVMAHESFTDPATAAQMNADFVSIKVDREERPDVDAIYMTATQALTGQGGWPMTCFLTPGGEPFYAGTYFPPVATSGLPAFRQLLTAISQAWRGDRDNVLQSAGRIGAALAQIGVPAGNGALDTAALDTAARRVLADIDPMHGGFTGAPKFPPSMVAEFLLRHHERTGSAQALHAVSLTLERMARGGIYDQLGGGFCRYSVDDHWHVPHFEKMLDDNAQLLRVYAHHARLTGSALSGRIAGEIGKFLLRDMRLPLGGFAVALDADTAGVEGATYLFGPDELAEILGRQDGPVAAELFGLAPAGTAGTRPRPGAELAPRVLRLSADPPDAAVYEGIRQRLLAARNQRPQPIRDEIVVMRSNGLAVAALAEAGALLDRDDWVAAAGEAADHVLAVHKTGAGYRHSSREAVAEAGYRHSSRDGAAGPGSATLADLADLAGGLLALYQATGDLARLQCARELLDAALHEFADPAGGFFDAAADPSGGPQILRPKDPTDGAVPSGLSALAHALIAASALTGDAALRRAAEDASASVAALATAHPRAAGWHLAAAEALLAGPLQVAVSGPEGDARDLLARTARAYAPGGSVIEVGDSDAPGRPLLADRPGIDGGPAAYVCRGFVCDRPVAADRQLIELLRNPARSA